MVARPLEFEEIQAPWRLRINEGGKKMAFIVHRGKRETRWPLDGDGVPMSRKTRFYSRLNKLKHKPLVSRPPSPYPLRFLSLLAHHTLQYAPTIRLFHREFLGSFYYIPRTRRGRKQGCGHSRRVIPPPPPPPDTLYRGRIYLSIGLLAGRGHLVA